MLCTPPPGTLRRRPLYPLPVPHSGNAYPSFNPRGKNGRELSQRGVKGLEYPSAPTGREDMKSFLRRFGEPGVEKWGRSRLIRRGWLCPGTSHGGPNSNLAAGPLPPYAADFETRGFGPVVLNMEHLGR